MVAFRTASTAWTIGSSSIPIGVPADAQAGDVGLLFVVSQNNTVTITPPSGFSTVGQARGSQNITVDVYAKELTAGEPGTDLTVGSSDAAIRIVVHLLVYSGTAVPTNAASVLGGSTTPTLTVSGDGVLVEQAANRGMDLGVASWTPPAGRAERTDAGAGSTGQVGVSCATGDMPVTAGTVGGGSWTPTSTSSHTAAWSVFLPDVQAATPPVWYVAGASGWVPSSLERL